MIDAIAAMLLILAVGLCAVAFPFVLWLLFSRAPRSKHAHLATRGRGATPSGSSDQSDDVKFDRSWDDEFEERGDAPH
jgi:hypothetical protein